VVAAASAAYGAGWSWGPHTKYDDPGDPEFYERQERYDEAEHELLTIMRKTLSIPEGDLSLPLPGYSAEEGHPGVEITLIMFVVGQWLAHYRHPLNWAKQQSSRGGICVTR
jgi:hypothetical protein